MSNVKRDKRWVIVVLARPRRAKMACIFWLMVGRVISSEAQVQPAEKCLRDRNLPIVEMCMHHVSTNHPPVNTDDLIVVGPVDGSVWPSAWMDHHLDIFVQGLKFCLTGPVLEAESKLKCTLKLRKAHGTSTEPWFHSKPEYRSERREWRKREAIPRGEHTFR